MKRKILVTLALAMTAIPAFTLARPGNTASAASGGRVLISPALEAGGVEARDWNDVPARLEEEAENARGQNINVVTGGDIQVSEEIMGRLAGRNITLAMHTGDGLAFSISGRDVNSKESSVHISLCEEAQIPEEAKKGILAGAEVFREFCMEDRGAFPCTLNVHLALGEENAGRNAVLYYYDEVANSMVQEGVFPIQDSGNAMFGLRRGDEYIVVVMGGYRVASGDVLSRIAVRNGVSLRALKEVNPQIKDVDKIREGQLINIPNH